MLRRVLDGQPKLLASGRSHTALLHLEDSLGDALVHGTPLKAPGHLLTLKLLVAKLPVFRRHLTVHILCCLCGLPHSPPIFVVQHMFLHDCPSSDECAEVGGRALCTLGDTDLPVKADVIAASGKQFVGIRKLVLFAAGNNR